MFNKPISYFIYMIIIIINTKYIISIQIIKPQNQIQFIITPKKYQGEKQLEIISKIIKVIDVNNTFTGVIRSTK
jgi:hypothetical protein